ncbi:hypothetical protein D9V37_08240 [Nocardioides mangrovicus]|uniref:Uncharacterized protein n=1 Tax=Nocardioides mangrovicus TaxID=2478913 RepID=A0A3L8P4A2_9ACTN|nr:hypothetical protein [Nocardioides mangrovicus]RLV49867.1 hypothetical protein D9V37_08240 [Nocardioides mangrovicus]
MSTTWLIVVGLVPVALIVVLALVLRGRLQERWFGGTGLQEWRSVARSLPWRDRWALWRANAAGRATRSSRLAPFAVQRGQALAAASGRMAANRSVSRTLVFLASVAAVTTVVTGDVGVFGWLSLVLDALLLLLGLCYRRLHLRQQARFVDSVRRNQELAAR